MGELMSGLKKYVQVLNTRDDGFVEFYFAIDDPSVYAELLLPYKEFIKFCSTNRVNFFTVEQEKIIENELLQWKYGIENVDNKFTKKEKM
jgi:phenol hydroxylase P0 protein